MAGDSKDKPQPKPGGGQPQKKPLETPTERRDYPVHKPDNTHVSGKTW